MKKMLCLLLGCLSAAALADYKQFYYQRSFKGQNLKSNFVLVSTLNYQQKLDHFDEVEKRTFLQRAYVNSQYALNNNAPVLFYICGEATCHESSVTNGAIVDYARRYNAVIVALEHRYYGKSQPFDKLTAENMRYLSTDQAIEDLARFQRHMMKEGYSGKWVALGGSYPGNLSAYYRLKHPELVVGSLASSAPVRPEERFEEYDEHVTKVVGPVCAAKMNEVVAEIEAAIDNPEKLVEFKQLFDAQAVEDVVDFLYVVADIGAVAAQYGYVERFCLSLTQSSSALKGYAEFAKYIFASWGMTALDMSISSATSTNPDDYLTVFGMRQWLYQSCTEYGYWQVAANVEQSTRSQLIDLDYHNKVCERLFGLTKPVDTSHIYQTFYLPLLNGEATNILFTNGSTDPWSNLSLVSTGTDNTGLLFYMITGAAHCDDLRTPKITDSEMLKTSREIFSAKIGEWLNN